MGRGIIPHQIQAMVERWNLRIIFKLQKNVQEIEKVYQWTEKKIPRKIAISCFTDILD